MNTGLLILGQGYYEGAMFEGELVAVAGRASMPRALHILYIARAHLSDAVKSKSR